MTTTLILLLPTLRETRRPLVASAPPIWAVDPETVGVAWMVIDDTELATETVYEVRFEEKDGLSVAPPERVSALSVASWTSRTRVTRMV